MSAVLRVVHEHGRRVVVAVEGDGVGVGEGAGRVEIASYDYDPQVPDFESRKPYLHPLRTLSGGLVSAYRPNDHRWHKGLQMTVSHLSDQNFWGGYSYRHGQGYVPVDNIGRMRHDRFAEFAVADHEVRLVEELTWVTAAGEDWVTERRELRWHGVDVERGTWALDFGTELCNVRGRDLHVGSPTTHGRPDAGYTGFFWRGPRGFTGGEVLVADEDAAPEPMGATSPWLAYTGLHDEVDGGATLLFMAGTSSAAVPLRWFVRREPFPAVNPSPAFSEEVTLAPGDALTLRHRVVVVDRPWTRSDVAAHVAEHPL
ncbi:PmoA family protein [Blastococcus sp. SYSU DS0552]